MSSQRRFRVNADGLNLRSEPVVRNNNRLAVLTRGQQVEKLGEAEDPKWWEVATTLQGVRVTGYVSSVYLKPDTEVVEPPPARGVREVHMEENRPSVKRSVTSGRAYPLGEPGRPGRNGTTPAEKAADLRRIIDWLKVETSPRYLPSGGATYCNIYAYDYCYLAGVYLPRVWWTGAALAALANGRTVTPRYGDTLEELTANRLYKWFEDFGEKFGWKRVFDLTQLQDSANQGRVCIICAQRADLNKSGHILAVVPEGGQHRAVRDSDGKVIRPLQSEAGAANRKYTVGTRAWWTDAKFRRFGFWEHK